jgi:hypothetical protein
MLGLPHIKCSFTHVIHFIDALGPSLPSVLGFAVNVTHHRDDF